MRAVVQRTFDATVEVDGIAVGGFTGPGLAVLVGVTHGDRPADAQRLADKVYDLRIFQAEGEKSAAELGLPVLVVSQFTLYADTRKGRRPTWHQAAPGPIAEPLIDAVAGQFRARGADVSTGVFGAHMTVRLANDGPMTVIVDVPA